MVDVVGLGCCCRGAVCAGAVGCCEELVGSAAEVDGAWLFASMAESLAGINIFKCAPFCAGCSDGCC